ncbi:ESPR-type extended signal peptide-containing protein, partial [Burkholderia cepacia]|uniref:ESPR-type extended signal peptide-containing protein n=1 Tax=Burkholderia cepacia TaxID=292 RepID=UPI0021AB3FEF
MNRLYKTVWNEESGAWVAVSELTRAQGKVSRAGRNSTSFGSTSRGELRRALKPIMLGVAVLATGVVANSAWAGSVVNCMGPKDNTGSANVNGAALGSFGVYQNGQWSGANADGCKSASGTNNNGVIISENGNGTLAGPGGINPSGTQAYMTVGQTTGFSPAGGIMLYGPSGIALNGLNVGAANAAGTSTIANVTAGVNPTDAVNVSQLTALSTVVSQNTADIAALQKGAAGGGSATGNNSTSVGGNSTASGNNSTGTGQASNAAGDNGTATGQASNAAGNNGTATGQASNAAGNNGTATGQASNAAGNNGTATGQASNAAGNNSTATGQASNAAGNNGTATG